MKLDKSNIISFLSLAFGLISLGIIWNISIEDASALTEEDELVENLSALFYAIGIIACLVSAIKVKHYYLAIIWLILCIIFFGEETSWLQRHLNYSVPWVEDLNAQGEFNLHNFKIFQGGKLLNSSSEFSILLIFKAQNLFRIGFFGYFIILPLLINLSLFRRIANFVGYNKPPTFFTISIVTVFSISFAIAIFASTPPLKSALAETREMLYAFFIMIYTIVYIFPLCQGSCHLR